MLHLTLPGSGHDGSRIVLVFNIEEVLMMMAWAVLACASMELVIGSPGQCLYVIYCELLCLNMPIPGTGTF